VEDVELSSEIMESAKDAKSAMVLDALLGKLARNKLIIIMYL
jgi:hypothetical protein